MNAATLKLDCLNIPSSLLLFSMLEDIPHGLLERNDLLLKMLTMAILNHVFQ
jgi:hypothetical protein